MVQQLSRYSAEQGLAKTRMTIGACYKYVGILHGARRKQRLHRSEFSRIEPSVGFGDNAVDAEVIAKKIDVLDSAIRTAKRKHGNLFSSGAEAEWRHGPRGWPGCSATMR